MDNRHLILIIAITNRLKENGTVEITMQKATPSDEQPWWSCVIVGDPGIDVKDIEGAKYLDDSLLKKIKVSCKVDFILHSLRFTFFVGEERRREESQRISS